MTRYDKSKAFARVMLAGIGRIHVDAKVRVFELPIPKHEKVAEFSSTRPSPGKKGVVEVVTNVKK